MNLPSDLKDYRAPRDQFAIIEESLAFLALVALAIVLLAIEAVVV